MTLSIAGSADARKLLLTTLAVVMVASCGSADPEQRQLVAFATLVTITVSDTPSSEVDAAVADLQHLYARYDRDWYPWPQPGQAQDGELVTLNKALAAGKTVAVSPDLAALIRRGQALERQSAGRFSLLTGRLSRLWGLVDPLQPAPAAPSAAALADYVQAVRAGGLYWQDGRLGSRSPSVEIDLGGIAKGAILQASADLLHARGISNAIIDLGGDLLVLGDVGGRPARIGIRSPRTRMPVAALDISDGESVFTSGDYERFVDIDGQRYQHIIDPRTGRPVAHTSSATVVHTDPVLADAAATALVVGGTAEFDRICAELGIELAMIIDATGDRRLTRALEMRVNWLQ